jgi:hypothetical protein
MGIATAHWSKVTHVSIKVYFIWFTAMFGINKLDIMRSAGPGVSQIMQEAPSFTIPVASFTTDGTFPPSVVPGAMLQNWLWQIFWLNNLRYFTFIFLHVVALLCILHSIPPPSAKCKENPN